jgi:putative ABC transport system ATP-binding protein
MAPILQAKTISRRLDDGRALLDGASLTVEAGERLAIQGPAGAGKSLLLRSLAQLDPVDEGELLWRGEPVRDHDVPAFRRHVAYLAQTPALTEGTVETNLKLPFTLGVYRDRAYSREYCHGLLERLGRDRSFFEQSIADLSGGERQIVALVRLLQLEPSLLLLDEPTAALDPDTTERAEEAVRDWVESDPANRAYVWVGHDDRQARRVTRRRVRMERGRLVDGA